MALSKMFENEDSSSLTVTYSHRFLEMINDWKIEHESKTHLSNEIA